MAENDPTQAPPFERKLPSSFSAVNATGSEPAKAPVVRSMVPSGFRASGLMKPPPYTAAAIPVRIVPANPFRATLILRLLGGDATTVLGLVAPDFKNGDTNYIPILNGETVTLDFGGEIWIAYISGSVDTTKTTLYIGELISPVGQ
jgi:hypothetical protein